MNVDACSSNSDCSIPVGEGLALTTQQRGLMDELTHLDGRLANMYCGALHVLDQTTNPDRYALAAHALRELIEKLAEWVDAPIAGGPSLKERVNQLRQKWPGRVLETLYGERANTIGTAKPVRVFLEKAREFFNWYDEGLPSRREKMGKFFAATDPVKRRLLPAVERAHISQWFRIRDELIAVAHHGNTPVDADFRKLLASLESLLDDRLRPKVFEQQEALDQIIAEGEGNA